MANTTSAKKATRKIARRTVINKSRRTEMRTSVRSVEEAIKRYPGVVDAAVVGVPDPRFGERICAVVDVGEAAPPSLDQIAEHVRQSLARALDTLSPLATLGRGYAIVRRTDGAVVTEAASAAVGERLQARLAKGSLVCDVVEVNKE